MPTYGNELIATNSGPDHIEAEINSPHPMESETNNPLSAAIYYASRGWPVLALHTVRQGQCTCNRTNCASPGKHPQYDKNLQPNGLKSATTEVSSIRKLWEQWPDANVGIATGDQAGLVVIDVDPRYSGDHSLHQLENQYGKLPETLRAWTGGGGYHLLFAHPGSRVSNIQSTSSQGRGLGVGVDIRGDGGYIVAPPSLHLSGKRYRWEGNLNDIVLADIPAWLLRLLAGRSSEVKRQAGFSNVQSIPEGKRNTTLTSIAGKLRRLGKDEGAILEALRVENEQNCKPPLDIEEVASISRSVARYEPGEFTGQLNQDGIPSTFRLTEKGVYAVDPTGEKPDIFICSPLRVVASGRSHENEDWGQLLHFEDRDGKLHKYLMPMAELAGDGNEYRKHLLGRGLRIAPGRKVRELLTTYIQQVDPPARVRCVERVGWHDRVFVLPDESIGKNGGEDILFQTAARISHNHRVSGTLEEWREKVSKLCSGNSRLLFSVSCAFAGPLLNLFSEVGGGFHFRGLSSTGKTTVLYAAGSVWGGGGPQGYLLPWRTTANGLEAVAEIHNDGLLCLDELGQCSPYEAGEIAYSLANGSGKLRMTRSITARKKLEWKVIFLSSGEIGLADHVAQTGKKVRGGQDVRLCDLEADSGVGLGAFENIHEFNSPAEFAQHLRGMSLRFYGSAIRDFLIAVVKESDQVQTAIHSLRDSFVKDNMPDLASGEVNRVASRFAVVAAAGEHATDRGITGWREGEATGAAVTLFKTWLRNRGSAGAGDIEAAIRQVRAFIEAHGESRFQGRSEDANRVTNRVGFKSCDEDGVTEYQILREAFRNEVCKGYDYKMVAKALAEYGYLKTDYRDLTTVVRRIPGQKNAQTRVYALKPTILGPQE